jgi:hypothetical protein
MPLKNFPRAGLLPIIYDGVKKQKNRQSATPNIPKLSLMLPDHPVRDGHCLLERFVVDLWVFSLSKRGLIKWSRPSC